MRPALLLRERPAPAIAAAIPAEPSAEPAAEPSAWDRARRRIAVRLADGAAPGGMRVLHQLLTAPDDAADDTDDADPDLARHRRGEFLRQLAAELAGPAAARLSGFAAPPPHLALPLAGAVEALAALAPPPPGPPPIAGIAIDCAEIGTNLPGFAALRAASAARGIALSVTGITAGLLAIAEPESLGADLLELTASPALAEAGPRIAALREAAGAARLLLAGADSEEWLRWGVTQGIRRFEGAQTDMLLAAARRLVCPHARLCPLPACAGRATAMGAATRAGCLNPVLLDRGA